MKKLIVSTGIVVVIVVAALFAGFGQPASTTPPADALSGSTAAPAGSDRNRDWVFDESSQQWMDIEAPEYTSVNRETIVTGPDGQQVVLNSYSGTMLNPDGSPYQPMPIAADTSSPVQPSFNIRPGAAGPVDWDIDGNPVYSRENPTLPSGEYRSLSAGETAPAGAVVTPGGRMLVPVQAEDAPITPAVTAAPTTHHELVAALKWLVERYDVLFRAGPGNTDQFVFELYAIDDARQNVLARIKATEGAAPAPSIQKSAPVTVAVTYSQKLFDEVAAQVRALEDARQWAWYQVEAGYGDPDALVAELEAVETARKQAMARIGLTE